jgi:hypothetical protein
VITTGYTELLWEGYMVPFGYDYGTKPIVLVGGDVEFIDLLNRGFLALGYGRVPEFGLLIDVPLLLMGFKNETLAQECFTHFAEWSGDSADGDAVRISFVEFNDGEFGMCVSQDMERLLKRSISEIFREELEPRIMVVGHIKMFPHQSEGYRWFKSEALSSPFVLAPQSINGEPLKELALRKREINFYREDEIPEHTIENFLARNRNAKEERYVSREIPREFRLSMAGIHERRRIQLSRFFPVTLERLRFSREFIQTKQQLISEGFREWQILQAGCNVALRHLAPEFFEKEGNGADPGQRGVVAQNILAFLIGNHQTLSLASVLADEFNVKGLTEQIYEDSSALLRYVLESDVEIKDPSSMQGELVKHNLLDT